MLINLFTLIPFESVWSRENPINLAEKPNVVLSDLKLS